MMPNLEVVFAIKRGDNIMYMRRWADKAHTYARRLSGKDKYSDCKILRKEAEVHVTITLLDKQADGTEFIGKIGTAVYRYGRILRRSGIQTKQELLQAMGVVHPPKSNYKQYYIAKEKLNEF